MKMLKIQLLKKLEVDVLEEGEILLHTSGTVLFVLKGFIIVVGKLSSWIVLIIDVSTCIKPYSCRYVVPNVDEGVPNVEKRGSIHILVCAVVEMGIIIVTDSVRRPMSGG